MLLPRGTALLVVVLSTVVAVGVRSSFSADFLLDFFEKKHPILLFFPLATSLNHFSMRNVSSDDTRNVRKKLTFTLVDTIFFSFPFPSLVSQPISAIVVFTTSNHKPGQE